MARKTALFVVDTYETERGFSYRCLVQVGGHQALLFDSDYIYPTERAALADGELHLVELARDAVQTAMTRSETNEPITA